MRAIAFVAVVPALLAVAPDTRLVEAARRNDVTAVTTLLAAAADVSAPEPDGTTAALGRPSRLGSDG